LYTNSAKIHNSQKNGYLTEGWRLRVALLGMVKEIYIMLIFQAARLCMEYKSMKLEKVPKRKPKGSQLIDGIFRALKHSKKPLTASELALKISSYGDYILHSKEPRNTIYSIIYKTNKRLLNEGKEECFLKVKIDNNIAFILNK
jgi:hypothetical protein